MTRHFLPIAVLTACVLAVHAPAMVRGQHLTAHHDNLDGAAPLRIEAARQWNSGHVPLWNPYKRVGMPLAADTTAGALYPGNLPFLWLTPDSDWRVRFQDCPALKNLEYMDQLMQGLASQPPVISSRRRV